MDPSLRKRGAETMRDIDRHYAKLAPGTFQIEIGKFTSLSDAVAISQRMKAGVKGEGALQVFNPEMVHRKVAAEREMQVAVARMNTSITKVNLKIERSRSKINYLRELLALGPDSVRTVPSINRRTVRHQQVVFPSNVQIPEDAVQTKRVMTKKQKMASRKHDAVSQITYWKLNLKALEAKEADQIAFRDSLVISRDQFAKAALELPTLIGSGFSDYKFAY